MAGISDGLLSHLLFDPMVIASISMTVTKSKLFTRPRNWVKERSPFAGSLVSCPYCFSHWIAIWCVALTPTMWPAWFAWIFMLVTLSSPWMGIIRWGGGSHG